ncbi:MAG: TolC family protein [Syntrophomonadaceae bacterium]|nr:TolC family protein [Syntrophomonadaceae bacterium]
MKTYSYFCLALALCLSLLFPMFTYAEEEPILKVTIDDALQIAYANNPDLRKANLEVEKAQIQRDDAAKYVTWIPTGGMVVPAYQQIFNAYQQAEIALTAAKKAQASEKKRVTQEVITAYTKALKDYNTMESTRIKLQDLENQKRIAGMSMGLGLISELDYQKLDSSIKQAQEGYKSAQAAYESSIASLRYLLGKGEDWNPKLASRAVLDTYNRHELNVELSRGLSESVLVMTQKALLDIEKSKEDWILPNVSSNMQKINSGMAEINYEQAKRNAKATIEQLYYGIDALEGQIQAAESALATAQKDLEIAELKYEVGVISRYAIPGADSLSAAEVTAETARMNIENLKADLAQMKAQFAYLTGQEPYDPADWIAVE